MGTPRRPATPKPIETDPDLRRNQLLEEIRDTIRMLPLSVDLVKAELHSIKQKMK